MNREQAILARAATDRVRDAALRAARDVVRERLAARPAAEIHVGPTPVHVAPPAVTVGPAAVTAHNAVTVDMAPVAAALDRMTDAMAGLARLVERQLEAVADLIEALRNPPVYEVERDRNDRMSGLRPKRGD